ncbi:MucBP domain-containing protein [Listeria kieliensis]
MVKRFVSLWGILFMGLFLFIQPLDVSAQSETEYDLKVNYNPASFEKFKVNLPLPEELKNQELEYEISLTANFFSYKSNAPLRMKSVDYSHTISPASEQNSIQMSAINNFFKSSSDINYQGFTIFIDYQNKADGTVTRVWYNIKFINGLVTAYYLDENGSELVPPFQVIGTIGEPYAVQAAPQIPGYSLVNIEGAEQGIYTDPILTNRTQEVIYTYTAESAPQKGQVIASFVDENGDKLVEPESIEGEVGQAYQIEAKQLEGYQLKTIHGKQKGLFSLEQQNVQFVYEKLVEPVAAKGQVTVHFLDEEGKKLADDYVMQGELGVPYEVKVESITGYQFKENIGELAGTFSDTNSEVTLVYEKESIHRPDESGNTLQEEPTQAEENKDAPYQPESAIKTNSQINVDPIALVSSSLENVARFKQALPATGDHSGWAASLLGLWAAAIGAFYLYKKQ